MVGGKSVRRDWRALTVDWSPVRGVTKVTEPPANEVCEISRFSRNRTTVPLVEDFSLDSCRLRQEDIASPPPVSRGQVAMGLVTSEKFDVETSDACFRSLLFAINFTGKEGEAIALSFQRPLGCCQTAGCYASDKRPVSNDVSNSHRSSPGLISGELISLAIGTSYSAANGKQS